jgi:hypothetical protein
VEASGWKPFVSHIQGRPEARRDPDVTSKALGVVYDVSGSVVGLDGYRRERAESVFNRSDHEGRILVSRGAFCVQDRSCKLPTGLSTARVANNNNNKRQGKCPSDHDHDHSNTIEIVSQSRGDIVIGCLSQI